MMFIDNFSGRLAELKRGHRTEENALKTLALHLQAWAAELGIELTQPEELI